jgi:peptidoglycan/LPS O-acetylase OafA/YrhL
MGSPSTRPERYIPALDGLRAFAVAGVMAYHLNYGWAAGGYLGVDLFFVLSGFLITGLLLGEWQQQGRVRFGAFWGRRARRLLPAVLLLLAVLAAYSAVGGSGIDRPTLRSDSLATLFYFANWHYIFGHQSYFAQFAAPSPLLHTWSLAIEEQFYLLWPLLLVGIVGASRHAARKAALRRALVVTVALALASAALMGLLYHPGRDPSVVYYGTESRAFELLLGAGLAMLLQRRAEPTRRAKLVLDTAALAGFAAILCSFDTLGGPPGWMYRGGMFAGSLVVAIVIAGVSQPQPGPLGRFLSLPPIRWVGRISYGLYLWHWPVFVLMTDTNTGLTGIELNAARVATTFAIATASYYLLELPIRRARASGWRTLVAAPTGVVVTAAAVLFSTVPVTSTAAAASAPAVQGTPAPRSGPAPGAQASVPVGDPFAMTASGDPVASPPGERVASASDPLRVMVIGDSVMWDAEPGVAAALESTGAVKVYNESFFGWGLTQTDAWRTEWPRDIQQFRPDVVIGMWSWDNQAALADPTGYASLVDQALQVLLAPGSSVSQVALLQFPKSGPDEENPDAAARTAAEIRNEQGREAWNAVVSGLVPLWQGRLMFLPVAGALELNGDFAFWLPTGGGSWVRVRKIDGVHVCPSGAARLGQAVLDDLTPIYRLPPASPGWWDQAWTRDTSRYTSQDCPDDQPPPGYAASVATSDPETLATG